MPFCGLAYLHGIEIGFHLSELNFPISSLTCTFNASSSASSALPSSSSFNLPQCLNMSEAIYGFVTAIFTVGGLLGSLSSSSITSRYSLKGSILLTGYVNLVGSLLMTLSPHWAVLALGRLVSGVASGLSICSVPPFLAVLSTATDELQGKKGLVGTMNQMGVVIGICSAQMSGLILTGEKGDIPGSWRYVVLLSGVMAVFQILMAGASVYPNNRASTNSIDSHRLNSNSPLLPNPSPSTPSTSHQFTLKQVLASSTLRTPSIFCTLVMALQQLSGVNAVMFYSTPVLKPLLPTSAGEVGVGITVVNALMTLPALFLMDRVSRKTLLLSSISGMAATSLLLAVSLTAHFQVISAVSIVAFIASFSIGLGPVPFLLTAEVVPPLAVPALSSLAISTNWITNFLVAIFFLPLRDLLSSPIDTQAPGNRREGEGRVFYVFTMILVLGGIMIQRRLKA
nr:vacuolar membrane protein [Cryptococcus depauperatus CBS 7855]